GAIPQHGMVFDVAPGIDHIAVVAAGEVIALAGSEDGAAAFRRGEVDDQACGRGAQHAGAIPAAGEAARRVERVSRPADWHRTDNKLLLDESRADAADRHAAELGGVEIAPLPRVAIAALSLRQINDRLLQRAAQDRVSPFDHEAGL